MERIRGGWYGMIGALMLLAVNLAAAPVLAETVSYGFEESFRITLATSSPPNGIVGGDDIATVNDPQVRTNQDIRIEPIDGITHKTFRASATVLPPTNSAWARTTVTANPYIVDPHTGYTLTGGTGVSGRATAVLPNSTAFAFSTGHANISGDVFHGDGTVTRGIHADFYSTSHSGTAEVNFDLLCQVDIEAVRRLLLQGVIDIAGETKLSWDSRVPERNFIIQAPAKSGNNVHFLLNLPGPYTKQQGKLEVIIKDGILKEFTKKGTIFAAVNVLQEGDKYYLSNLGPLTFDYHIGDIGNKKPKVRMELRTRGRCQLAKRGEEAEEQPLPAPEQPTSCESKLPTFSEPRFYAGLYGGPTFGNVSPNNPSFFNRGGDARMPATVNGNFTSHATTTTNLTGGLKLGTWGTYSFLPAWMKYVGVNLDFSYQNLNLQHQTGYFREGIAGGNAGLSSSAGHLSTLGLMVNGRYGFFPNPEVSCLGQLQPYLGVGPVLGIASLSPTFSLTNFTNYGQQVNIPINETHKFSSRTSVFPALGVEAGLRYLPLRNVYLDVSYRYLYGQPSFSFSNANSRFNMDPTFNNHSLRIGAGLMF